MTEIIDASVLSSIFGEDSSGRTPEERARTSRREFVRGQTMLAEASPAAKGRRLAAYEALSIFGLDVLRRVIEDGQVAIVSSRAEPATTIKNRREALGISIELLARMSGVTLGTLEKMETPGKVSPIRDIEKVAPPLAIDERYLGLPGDKSVDNELGVRFRRLFYGDGKRGLTASIVGKLTEAAWLIARQQDILGSLDVEDVVQRKFEHSHDYTFPTYEAGYRLAARTRALLGIDEHVPIPSLRRLIEHDLNIPLIETELGQSLAGATIANGNRRGIVANIQGRNENPWIRRMTLAHELGHLLWDPDQHLERLAVDRYDEIIGEVKNLQDRVEMRANAFAVAFLAPPAEVDRIVRENGGGWKAAIHLSEHFGISLTASRAHIQNICRFNLIAGKGGPEVSDEWKAQEDRTNDFFPITETPVSRRGRFSWAVVSAVGGKLISEDTAAALLNTSVDKFRKARGNIFDLTS